MNHRIASTLSAALAFSVLAGGTAAIGSELFAIPWHALPSTQVVQLPRVVVIGHVLSANAPLASADSSANAIQPATQRVQ